MAGTRRSAISAEPKERDAIVGIVRTRTVDISSSGTIITVGDLIRAVCDGVPTLVLPIKLLERPTEASHGHHTRGRWRGGGRAAGGSQSTRIQEQRAVANNIDALSHIGYCHVDCR